MESNTRDNMLHVVRYNAKQIEEQNVFISKEVVIYRVVIGRVTIQHDQQKYNLQAGCNFILAESSLTKITAYDDNSVIEVCRLSKLFTDKIYLLIDFKVVDILFGSDSRGYISINSDNMAINQTLDKLFAQYNNFAHPMREQYIHTLTYCYLFELYEEAFKYRKSSVAGSSKYVNYSIDRFFQLCQESHIKEHSTTFYADKLGLSNRYLYKIVKSVTNQTPKQVISSYLMESARRLLLTTTHSTQEIAELLNFPDQSSFGQFFKRNAGINPSEFRRRY